MPRDLSNLRVLLGKAERRQEDIERRLRFLALEISSKKEGIEARKEAWAMLSMAGKTPEYILKVEANFERLQAQLDRSIEIEAELKEELREVFAQVQSLQNLIREHEINNEKELAIG